MTKTIFSLVFLLTAGIATAQDVSSGATKTQPTVLLSKKGEPILPEEGDWGIQINALPLLSMFTVAGAPAPTASFLTGYPATIALKKFKTATTAYRMKAMLSLNSRSTKALVTRDGQTPPIDVNNTVEDAKVENNRNIILGAGIEKRRGNTRIQGFYGGEAIIMLGGNNVKYKYGNSFSSTNTAPASNNFDGNYVAGTRITEIKSGATFGIGARAFMGAEYFIAPKLSLGVEYGWGVALNVTGQGITYSEKWSTTESAIERTQAKTAGSSNFGINGDISGGAINLTFHF